MEKWNREYFSLENYPDWRSFTDHSGIRDASLLRITTVTLLVLSKTFKKK